MLTSYSVLPDLPVALALPVSEIAESARSLLADGLSTLGAVLNILGDARLERRQGDQTGTISTRSSIPARSVAFRV